METTQASDLPPSSDPAETAHSLNMAGEMLNLSHVSESGVTFSVPAVPVPQQQQYQAFNTPQVTTPEDGQPLFQHQAVQHQQQCHTLPGHHPSLQNPGAPQPPQQQQMSIALNNTMQPIEQHSTQPELIKVPYQQHLMAMAAAQQNNQQQFNQPGAALIGQPDRVTMVSADHHQEVQPQQLMMSMAQGQIMQREMTNDPRQMVTGLNHPVNMLPQQSSPQQQATQQQHQHIASAMDHSMAANPQVMVFSDQNITHRPSHDYGQPPHMAMQNQQQNQMIQDILFGQQQPQSQEQVMAVAAAAAARQAMAQEIARSRQQQQPQQQQQFATAAIPQTVVHEMARNDNIPANVIMLQRPDQLGMRQQQQQQQQQQYSAPQQPMQQIVFTNEQQMHQEQLQDTFSHEKIKQQAYSAAMLQQQQQQAMQGSDVVMEDNNGDSRRSSVHQMKQIAIPSPPSANEMTLQFQSTPALSESIAQKADVSAKEFEGMSREQLIARLMTLEQEKRKAEQQSSHPVDVVEVKSETSTNVDEEDEDGPSTPPDSHRTDANTERTAESNAEGDELDEEDEDEEAEAENQDQAAPEPMQCLWKDCGQMCDGMQKLIAHISDNHVGSGKPTYRCEWEGCPRNQKPFTKRHKMYNHLRTHTGERPFVCPKAGCGKRFSRPDSLTTHIKTHSNVRPYICPVKGCQKAYYHSRSLKKHEKTHENTISAPPIPYPSTQPYTYAGQVPVDFLHNVPMQMQQHMIDSQHQQQQHIPPPSLQPSPQPTSPPQPIGYTAAPQTTFEPVMMDTSVSTTTHQTQNFPMVMDPSAYATDGERFDGFGGV